MAELSDPYLRVPVSGGEVLILLGGDDDPGAVTNCDGHLLLDDGERRTFTALTLDEISSLLVRWGETGEESGGAYLRVPDLIVLRSGGVANVVAAVSALRNELPPLDR